MPLRAVMRLRFLAGHVRVGRIIAMAAAKYLTPVTLEVRVSSRRCAPDLTRLYSWEVPIRLSGEPRVTHDVY